ncbi:MAG TPA: dipeptidase [Blastocatellia bacterium]|nr:dipeptidase [Blastocatellia bacterium]
MNTDVSPQAQLSQTQVDQIHQSAIVIDMHADTIQRVLDQGADLLAGTEGWQVDIPMMRRGGLKAQFFSIWPDPFEYWGEAAYERAKALIGALDAQLEKHPDYLERALSADDIKRIVKKNRIAALMGIEGGHAINDNLAALEEFYQRGVRYMTLTHSRSTSWAGSSGDEEGRQKGLSDLGRDVVREMNRLGMIVDISHVSDKTFWEVMDTATKPVIASHSAARALSNHHRNMTDEMIQAVAKADGVICVVFYPIFLDETYAHSARAVLADLKSHFEESTAHLDKIAAAYAKDRLTFEALCDKVAPMPLARLADHIDHIAKLVGTDHIGIGSDFDGISCVPQGLENVAMLPALTHELARRGYTQSDLEKILGGNILRVMDAQNGGAGAR